MRPTWRRTYHAHVAAMGAFVIDIIVFNGVLFMSGILPLAQLCGASSGSALNFVYNQFKTFSRLQQVKTKGGVPSEL
jgi:putative flippase GtrA